MCRTADVRRERRGVAASWSQAEIQKLEKKLADALDALKQEQLSSERSRMRDALEQYRLEQQLVVPPHLQPLPPQIPPIFHGKLCCLAPQAWLGRLHW